MKFRHLFLFAAADALPSAGAGAPPAAALSAVSDSDEQSEDEDAEDEDTEDETPAAPEAPEPAPEAAPEASVFTRARLLVTGKKDLVNQLLDARARLSLADAVAAELSTARAMIGSQAADIARLNADVQRLHAERSTVAQGVQHELASVGITPEMAPANTGEAVAVTREEVAAAFAAETDPVKKRAIYSEHKQLLVG